MKPEVGVHTKLGCRHKTVVYEHLPSQVGLRVVNSSLDASQDSPTSRELRSSVEDF